LTIVDWLIGQMNDWSVDHPISLADYN